MLTKILIACSKYDHSIAELQQARDEYIAAERVQPGVSRRRIVPRLPAHLAEDLPPFRLWLRSEVETMLWNEEDVDEDLLSLSLVPSSDALSFKSIWAYGNHFRVDIGDGREFMPYDSGVACMVSQPSRSSRRDRDIVISELKYVGVCSAKSYWCPMVS